MGNRYIKILCYADDAILIAEDEDGLQRLLYRFTTTAQDFNMIISTKKTQSMVISKEPIRCKVVANDKIIDQVMRFKYLGVETSSDRNLIDEIRTQTNKSSQISGFLKDVIWRNKNMNIGSKVRIYKTCIRPILTYAAETRADTSKTKRIMRTTEMKILRRIQGINLRDRVRRTTIRENCKIQDVVR